MLKFNPIAGTLDHYEVGSVTSVAGKTGAVTLAKGDVGLGNVDNTADSAKPISTATKSYVDAADLAHVQATDPHTQYMNSDRGDARYAGQPYAVMAKSQFASLSSSYGILGRIFGNDGYKNDLQVYGLSTQASTPTPDAPVPIVSTTGNVTVQSAGKNMFNRLSNIVTGSFLSANDVVTPQTDSFYQTDYVAVLPSTTYIWSSSNSGSLRIQEYNASKAYVTRTAANSISSLTITTSATTQFVRLSGLNADLTNLQFESGNVRTTYTAYISSTQTLPLGSAQLRSLPNGVSDRIYKDGSTWKLEQNVDFRVVDGSEAWGDASVDTGYFRGTILANTMFKSKIGMNNRLAERANSAHGLYEYKYSQDAAVSAAFYIQVTDARIGAHTMAAFKAWLAANPVTMLSDLATPVTTTITDPTLITALENIRTYQGVTNITASTPVSGSYGLDLTKTLAGKVNKAGDTSTGVQANTYASGNGWSHLRGGVNNSFGTNSSGQFNIYNQTSSIAMLDISQLGDGIGIGGWAGVRYLKGTGFPNGVVSAPVGSIYIDTAVTNGASSWIKKSGTGNTGWQVLEGDTGWRNINSLATGLTSGVVAVKRTENRTEVSLVDVVFGTNTGTYTMFSHPAGFAPSRGGNYVILQGGGTIRNLMSTSNATLYSLSSGGVINGTVSFDCVTAYPTTLPGVAV